MGRGLLGDRLSGDGPLHWEWSVSMARMRASWFVFARVPAAWLTRASFRSSTVALAAVLVSTSPARAQVADPTGVVQLGPHLDWAGIESTAPHDLRWDERLPESRPEPTAGDIRGDLPRSRMADLADIEGIFSYRFVGEHFSSFAGNSISFSDDTDCDGFSEVLIGSPLFGGQGLSGGPGAAYVVSVADMEAADAADGIVDRVVDLGFVAALPRSWKLVGAGQQGVGTAVASNGDANGDGCSDLLIGAPDRYSTGSAYVVSALDLPAADAADGEADGVVDIRRIADQPDSWEITDGDRGDSAGTQVAFVRDMNGDGRSDLLIGAPAFNAQNQPGAAYVLSGAALPSADAEDGVADGRIALTSVAAQPDSWKLVGENAGDRVGGQLSAANLDSDARSDFIVDASSHTAGLDRQGAVYLIAASDLPAMDSADGDLDGLIELRNAAGGNASWKLLGSARNQAIGSTHLGARAGTKWSSPHRPGLMPLTRGCSWFPSRICRPRTRPTGPRTASSDSITRWRRTTRSPWSGMAPASTYLQTSMSTEMAGWTYSSGAMTIVMWVACPVAGTAHMEALPSYREDLCMPRTRQMGRPIRLSIWKACPRRTDSGSSLVDRPTDWERP